MSAPHPDATDLRTCSACAGRVSRKAAACPHCGHPTALGAQIAERDAPKGKALPISALLSWQVFAAGWVVIDYVARTEALPPGVLTDQLGSLILIAAAQAAFWPWAIVSAVLLLWTLLRR